MSRQAILTDAIIVPTTRQTTLLPPEPGTFTLTQFDFGFDTQCAGCPCHSMPDDPKEAGCDAVFRAR